VPRSLSPPTVGDPCGQSPVPGEEGMHKLYNHGYPMLDMGFRNNGLSPVDPLQDVHGPLYWLPVRAYISIDFPVKLEATPAK